MGKFDGYLICSDLDGTFRKENSVEGNSKAVKYFIENGGKFTFATGRSTMHLRDPELIRNINAPACICNGAVIYDYELSKVLREERLKFTFRDFLDAISDFSNKIIRMTVFADCEEDFINLTDISDVSEEIKRIVPLKIVCVFGETEDADFFKQKAKELEFFNTSYISKSWDTGVEFNESTATKGNALDFIKAHLKNIHTAIGIGDYENDLPLLEYADIKVVPMNALDLLKEKADFVVNDASQCAIKEIIEKIEKEF